MYVLLTILFFCVSAVSSSAVETLNDGKVISFDGKDSVNGAFFCDPNDLPAPQDSIKIVYRLFPSQSSSGTIITSPSQIPSGELYIVTHGFASGWFTGEWPAKLVAEILRSRPGAYVIFVDWSDGAYSLAWPNYNKAVANVYKVAAMVMEFFGSSKQFKASSTHCIGHSLGAHVCGLFSARLPTNLARITGLDPAGPCFEEVNSTRRLDKSNADFVDIIHTDPLALGIAKSIGHSDFFPNNSPVAQPGCILAVPSCSHSRAVAYFTESINPPIGYCFPSCYSKTGPCQPKTGAKMGFHSSNSTVRGVLYGNFPAKESSFLVCEPQFCNPEKSIQELPSCDRRFVLVLDVSGSMDGDRIKNMRQAVIEFIDMADEKMKVGLVTFSSSATLKFAPALMTSSGKKDLKAITNKLTANGGTCIECGITRGVDALKGLERLGGDLILLTDGEDNTPWLQRSLPAVLNQAARVHTIALGTSADSNLEELARKTGGESDFILQGADLPRFISVFSTILQNAGSSDEVKHITLVSTTVTVAPNKPTDVAILLDSSLGDDNMVTSIYDPKLKPITGSMIPPSLNMLRQQSTYPCQDDSEYNKLYCRLDFKPEPGFWTLRLESKSKSTGSVTVTASAVVNETVEADTITVKGQLAKSKIGLKDVGERSLYQFITASVAFGENSLLDAQVNASIQSENGAIWTLTLHDDGRDFDWQAGDGIYTTAFNETKTLGRYSVSIFALGGSNEAFYMSDIQVGYEPGNCLDSQFRNQRKYVSFQRVTSAGTFTTVNDFSVDPNVNEPAKPEGYGLLGAQCSSGLITSPSYIAFIACFGIFRILF